MDPRSILSAPFMYRLFGTLIGARRANVEYVERYIRPNPSDRVLDCGCGPGDLLDVLPPVEYVGVDLDEEYIAAARSRFGDRATFRLGPVGDETIHETDHYDLVVAGGLLHHLTDDQVSDFLRVAHRSLKPNGRLVTIDGCFTDDQSYAARHLLRRDRGAYVRSLDAWLELARPVFPAVETHVRHDMLRIPWTHLVMVGPKSTGDAT